MRAAHAVYLACAIATHAALGYTLARLFTSAPAGSGVLGAIAPDLDLGVLLGDPLGLTHRGLLHAPIFVLTLAAAAALLARDRRVAAGVALGGGSHLVVDTFTETGVPWLFPWGVRYGIDAGIHALGYDAVVVAVCAALLLSRRRASDSEPRSRSRS